MIRTFEDAIDYVKALPGLPDRTPAAGVSAETFWLVQTCQFLVGAVQGSLNRKLRHAPQKLLEEARGRLGKMKDVDRAREAYPDPFGHKLQQTGVQGKPAPAIEQPR